MFKIFLFEGYLRKISNYLERITLIVLTLLMNVTDLIAITLTIPRIDNGSSLEKEFIELIIMNP